MSQKKLQDYKGSGVGCPKCGKECSNEHGLKIHHVRVHNESIRGNEVKCAWCGDTKLVQDWEIERNDNHFCDSKCQSKYHSENFVPPNKLDEFPEIECANCGTTKRIKPSFVKERNFCSTECHAEWQSNNRNGENAPNWKGGSGAYDTLKKTFGEKSWNKIRQEVRDKYGNECYICGIDEGDLDRRLDVHHIVPLLYGGTNGKYNLIPLCAECHIRTERHTEQILKNEFRIKEFGGGESK